MLDFVIAVLMCTGSNCVMLQPEEGISYPTAAACDTALKTKSSELQVLAEKRRGPGQTANLICVNQSQTIVEVEEPYDVLDSAIVHAAPSANGLYVGSVEKGTRTLVTGEVSGTNWLRVQLPDGKSGFVYSDRLRKVGAIRTPAPPNAATATAAAPPTAPPAAAPLTPAPQTAAIALKPPPAPPAPPPAAPALVQPAAPTAPPAQSAMSVPVPQPSPAARAPGGTHAGEFRDCENCPVMVTLPGGSFIMGSNDDPTERPPHMVTIHPFAIGKFELTVAEWNACNAAGACGSMPEKPQPAPERRPMTNLSWNDATQYVRWLAKQTGKPYRLLSEAEWEYAARAGAKTRYAWGEQAAIGKADCKGCDNPHDAIRPTDVGSFPPNTFGLYDTEGGVAEWVDDCWHLSYQGAPADGAAWRTANCSRHVLRGGSWNNPPSDITVSSRNFYDTDVRYVANGLRVALTLH